MTIATTIILAALLGLFLSPSLRHAFVPTPSLQAPGSAVNPRVSTDPGGALYLIWKDARESQSGDIFFNRSADRGQSWPPDAHWLDGEKPSGARSSSPQLAVDGQGHVYAAWWIKHRDGAKNVLVRTSRDKGVSFGPPVALNREHGAFPPEISADGKGHVYVVWADERTDPAAGGPSDRSGGNRIYLNRSADHGVTWLAEDVKLSGEAHGQARVMQDWPQIRSDAQGHVYVIWFDTRDGGGGVYFRASDDFGRTWREELRVKGAAGDVEGPMQLAADDQGRIYVAWADNRDGEYGIYLVASTDHGRTWSKELRLDVGKAKVARASLPALAADAAGHVYVAWQDARHGGWDIYLNRSEDFGQTWQPGGARINTGPPGEAEARFPQLALNGHGTVAAAWQEDRGAEQREGIYFRWSTDFGRTWLTADQRVDDPAAGEAAVQPQLAMWPDGTAALTWQVRSPNRKDVAVKVVPLSGGPAAHP
jgi:BNR repeat-like domain